jgi:methyl coenzyme M reductase subunit D
MAALDTEGAIMAECLKWDIHPGVSRHCQPLIPYSFTSSQGTFHSKQTTAYDAKMLGDATPGEDRIGLSVLNTVR